MELFEKELTFRVGVLALDVATHTGFCTENGSGVWDFSLKTKKGQEKPPDGKRLEQFHDRLDMVIRQEQIRIVVYEGPAVFSKFPNFVGFHMHGIVELVCWKNRIPCAQVPPSTLQKWAYGVGKSNKEKMVEAARRYKPHIKSDDEADAVLLYHHALEHLKINP